VCDAQNQVAEQTKDQLNKRRYTTNREYCTMLGSVLVAHKWPILAGYGCVTGYADITQFWLNLRQVTYVSLTASSIAF
jgi:hypothetical protein